MVRLGATFFFFLGGIYLFIFKFQCILDSGDTCPCLLHGHMRSGGDWASNVPIIQIVNITPDR